MFKYFLKRLAQMLVTLFIVSILVFVLANFIGDPVNMLVSPKAPPEVREQVREELGLNRPILEQYVSFVTNAFKGDFGKSYIYKVDVLSLIAQRVPATLELVFVSVVLALVISIPLGVYAGAFPKRKSSTLVMGGSILGISLPSFFIGIMLIYIFSLKLHWFPSSGRGATAPFLGMNFSLFAPGGLKYIILPAFTLSVTNIASLVRLTRAGVMENMRQDYIKSTRHFPACSHNFPKAGDARFQGRSRLFCLLGKFPYLDESRRILMAVSSKTSSKTRFYYTATRRISSAAVQPSIWA